MNWYKISKKKKKKRVLKKLVEPYVIDQDGVMKYKTPHGLMIAEDEENIKKD